MIIQVTEELTTEQRALAAAAPMEALRFLVETHAETDDDEQESEENLPSAAVGKKVGLSFIQFAWLNYELCNDFHFSLFAAQAD